MCQVDIIAAILKKLYFYNLIMECERLRQEEIERLEGVVMEEEEVKTSDYKELQESAPDEYLRRTLLPILYPVINLKL
jgi:hypothetical protein